MKVKLFILICLLSFSSFAQQITCDNKEIADAYKLAINTVDINIRRGILAAGGDYGGEWTRDISINAWNGVSLIRPEVAEASLWSVTNNKNTIGHQYWDKIIWVIAAYNHYEITKDKTFLKQAYLCSASTMKEMEDAEFDSKFGLFKGPSVFNDGIAGYPEPVFEPGNNSSGVTEHQNSKQIKCLSTNCIYYDAYKSLKAMAMILNENNSVIISYETKASVLKVNILKYFYDKQKNTFAYLIDYTGKVHQYQEGLGISFAVISGIISGSNATDLISNAVVSKFGITSICPDFPRYSSKEPGRHNNIVWPLVNGFFANAAVVSGNYKVFENELNNLTHLALDQDKGNYNFWEIYNPYTGKPDGGYQNGNHWPSCRYQTWSATAYLNMVYNGLGGIRINNDAITFEPFIPANIHYLELTDVKYGKSKLNIIIKGNGNKMKSFVLNGKKQNKASVPPTLIGNQKIEIEMNN